MRQMLGAGSQHFRTKEAAAGEISVDIQQPLVLKQDARAALVLEVHLPGGEGIGFQRMESAPHDADLRIGKHNADRRAAQARGHRLTLRETCGILTCSAPLVSRLVEKRDEVAGIARDENRAWPFRARSPSACWIERRHAFGVELERGLVETHARHIGRASGGSQNIIEIPGLLGAIWRRASNDDLVAVTLHGSNLRVGFQRELLFEGRDGVSKYLRVAKRAHAASASKYGNMNSQAMQCLAQLQADDSRADHGHRFGQIVPVEHVVANDETVAQGLERIRVVGPRAGCDDDAFGRNAGKVSDRQRMVVHETRMAANTVRVRHVLHVAQHETDKAVALAPDTIHDFAAIDAGSAIDMDAKTRCPSDGMGSVSGGNEKLARHAADACTGGAIVAAFDRSEEHT